MNVGINRRAASGALSCAMVILAVIVFPGCTDLGSNPASMDVMVPDPVPQNGEVSFATHIRPILQSFGCLGCHGGNGGLQVQTVAQLLQGGLHGPAVVPGNPESSNLVLKLAANPPFGSRMPQGGPYLPDSTVQTIRAWITQGAKNN